MNNMPYTCIILLIFNLPGTVSPLSDPPPPSLRPRDARPRPSAETATRGGRGRSGTPVVGENALLPCWADAALVRLFPSPWLHS